MMVRPLRRPPQPPKTLVIRLRGGGCGQGQEEEERSTHGLGHGGGGDDDDDAEDIAELELAEAVLPSLACVRT